jgi:hypothetical protein
MQSILKRLSKFIPNAYFSNYLFLQFRFLVSHKRFFNFSKTKKINDYLQFSKLHSKNNFTNITDKILLKEYLKSKGLDDHILKTYYVAAKDEKFTNGVFDQLPKNFVVKYNHNASGALISRNGYLIDVKKIVFKERVKCTCKMINTWLEEAKKENLFYVTREPQYLEIKPRWFIEEMAIGLESIPCDIKVHCIGGKPHFLYFALDREKSDSRVITDEKLNILKMRWEKNSNKSKFVNNFSKPSNATVNKILNLSEQISKDLLYIRVDFMLLENGDLAIGELTLHHGSGFDKITPESYETKFGRKIWENLKNFKY